jgi:hypothetical protein
MRLMVIVGGPGSRPGGGGMMRLRREGGRTMSGFRHCSWCHGKGCMCCDAEQAKWEEAEAKRKEAHANRTPAEICQSLVDLKWIRHGGPIVGVSLGAQLAIASTGRDNLDMEAIDREIVKEEALLDAEYDRQFPNGPEPIFTVRRSNPKDMELLKRVFGREALERAFTEGGRGMAEVEENAAVARAEQAATGKPPSATQPDA